MTKELTYLEIKEARDKYPPSKFEKFMFKYWSIDTKAQDLWVRRMFISFELVFFFAGFICVATKNFKIATFPTIMFSALLVTLTIPYTIAWCMNRSKVKKIAQYLGISVKEYNQYYT